MLFSIKNLTCCRRKLLSLVARQFLSRKARVRPSANVAIYTRHVERKAFDVTSLSSGDLIFQGKNHIHAKKVTLHRRFFSRRVLCKSQRLRSALEMNVFKLGNGLYLTCKKISGSSTSSDVSFVFALYAGIS